MSNRISQIVLFLLLLSQGPLVAETTTTDGDFGPELPVLRSLGLGGSMDATVEGDTLYVIGRGNLHVADISHPAQPKIVGRLSCLGNTRQIEIHRGVAYVTAREDGLFVIDVSKRETPHVAVPLRLDRVGHRYCPFRRCGVRRLPNGGRGIGRHLQPATAGPLEHGSHGGSSVGCRCATECSTPVFGVAGNW